MFCPVPKVVEAGELLIVRYTSAFAALTVLETVAVSFAALLSGSVPLTLTVLLTVPVAVGVTMMLTPALLVRFPMLQVTVPPANEQLPALAVAETNVTPAGSVSVTTTPVAVEVGPLL